ncbi:UL36 very large tegument protein [Streptomyces sp. NPDC053755]|uniref:UL36 very large tegument protein n=1 Tax=Streptomyces sp. NPDC053755 TaxID=3155815 RepID=UPI00344791EA
MTVYQLPAEMAAFAGCLRDLAARLKPDEGWYGVFVSREPEGLRACFDGTEVMPWDLVASLLQDAGEDPAGPHTVRARALYAAAAAAHDRRPGGAEALRERRELRERERRYAERRLLELGARLGAAPASPEAPRLRNELAWCRDDHSRATARIAALTTRLARLTATGEGGPATGAAPESPARPGPVAVTAPATGITFAPGADPGGATGAAGRGAPATPARVADPAPVKRRPRGARYAWMDEDEEVPPAVAVPHAAMDAAAAPRGARFGGSATTAASRPRTPSADAVEEAARAAGNAVYALGRLRAQGRSGEAHALLCEALAGPPDWLPALAAELHRAGLGADWSTLLWEAATLPPGPLAAVAGALADAGRDQDCDQLLRQGVARPVDELAGACAALRAEGRHREARALLAAFVRVHAPEEAARLAGVDPRTLVPQLLDAAGSVSPACARDLAHALRVAGFGGA